MANESKANILFYIKRIFGLILLLSLAAVFFFSGYSKLMSFEPFQWTFMDLGIPNMTAAAIIAYVFIGLEFMIGLFLLLHIYLKQVTYPATITMLVLLTAYLVILIIKQGNTGNCGCFGDWIYMKPVAAVWKNLVMIAVTVLLMFIYPVKPYKNQEWISVVAGMAAIVAPFVITPLNVSNEPKIVNEQIDLNPLYGAQPAPRVDLRQGKHIIAFMSLTCPHCRKAAYLLHIIKRQHPNMPIYLILEGDPDNYKAFFDETKAQNIPNQLFRNNDAFKDMAGDYVPAIYWVNNSVIERSSNYMQLDPAVINKWLKE
jgi:uncharacterized membrane protein YphA (DoxX/SURF4 family)